MTNVFAMKPISNPYKPGVCRRESKVCETFRHASWVALDFFDIGFGSIEILNCFDREPDVIGLARQTFQDACLDQSLEHTAPEGEKDRNEVRPPGHRPTRNRRLFRQSGSQQSEVLVGSGYGLSAHLVMLQRSAGDSTNSPARPLSLPSVAEYSLGYAGRGIPAA